MAADLVRLRVAVIVSPGSLPTFAAKAATTSIPIVFAVGNDPVQLGLVASLNRPGGNLTGFNAFSAELGAKGLALLHELMPSTATIGFLVNLNNPVFASYYERDVLTAATVIGLKVQILNAGTDREIDAAFVSLAQARTGALLVGDDLFSTTGLIRSLHSRRVMRFRVCIRIVSSRWRAGSSVTDRSLMDVYRQVGLYTGRILKGAKPADLPVVQATKPELIINLKTAKALGLTIPEKLLALADEVIE